MDLLEIVKFDDSGLIPVIAQDAENGEVLMLAYMNEAALQETLETGQVCYYSRSRQALWRKGESSGHVQLLKEARVDCDRDTLLLKVEQKMAACHAGYRSCFFRCIGNDGLEVVEEKVFDPDQAYGE